MRGLRIEAGFEGRKDRGDYVGDISDKGGEPVVAVDIGITEVRFDRYAGSFVKRQDFDAYTVDFQIGVVGSSSMKSRSDRVR